MPPHRGVTGRLEVSPNGEVRREMSVIRLKSGSLTEVRAAGEDVNSQQILVERGE